MLESSTVTMAPARSMDNPAPHWGGPARLRPLREGGVAGFLALCAIITVLTTLGIIVVLGTEAVHFFHEARLSVFAFLSGLELNPDTIPPKFGVLPLVWGTFVIAAGSSLIALPIGLLSAIYLSEYAPRQLRAVLKPSLELLAGIPTIVFGYLALMLVTPAPKAVVGAPGNHVETHKPAR